MMRGIRFASSDIVGDHQDGLAALDELLEQLEDRFGRDRVQVAGRFVRHDQRRVVRQGAGDGGPLLLTAGDRAGQLVGLIRQLDQIEQFEGARAALGGFVFAGELHRQSDVLGQAEGGQQLEELEDDAHILAAPDRKLALAHLMDRGVVDHHLPARWAGRCR